MSFNHDLIDFLIRNLKIKDSDTVLDFGFGDGYLLKKLNCKKYGIEKGDDLLEMDFNYIFFLDVIEHIPLNELQNVFKYFKRTLKNDGLLVISTPNINNLYQLIRFWEQPLHVRPYPRRSIEALCRWHGLKVKEVKGFHYFKNPYKVLVNLFLGLDWHNKNIFIIKKLEGTKEVKEK